MAFAQDIRRLEDSLADRVRNLLDRVAHLRARRSAYRQAHDELSALNDRELADLGLARRNIPRIAREAADSM